MRIWWWWHVARIISLQRIYGLYGLQPHIVEISGDVTDAGQTNTRTREDRATQPMNCWRLSLAILWWCKCSPNCNFHSFVGRKKERYPSDWETLAKLCSSNLNFAPISWHTFLNCSPPTPHQHTSTGKNPQNYSITLSFNLMRFPPKRWNVEK